MELFVFIQMGKTSDHIIVIELGDGAKEGLATFDARKAQCFLPRDRHKLCAVVEAAFGDLQAFNRVVRSLLRQRSTAGVAG